MEEQKLKIVQEALAHYLKYGIKSITMDDLATALGMSKKTLYQYFDNKDDLVHTAVQYVVEDEQCKCEMICKEYDNPIDQLFEINRFFMSKSAEVNPICIMDLKKYYSESWKLMECHGKDFHFQKVVENIQMGIKQGLYRNDLKVEATAIIYLTGVTGLINEMFEEKKHNIPAHEVFFEKIVYHIRAISTPKGITYLEEKLKNLN